MWKEKSVRLCTGGKSELFSDVSESLTREILGKVLQRRFRYEMWKMHASSQQNPIFSKTSGCTSL